MSAKRFPLRIRLKAALGLLRAAGASLVEEIPGQGALEPLTPVLLEPTESERYEHELAVALTNPRVRNIAITGGYGAGKSSLILTFKERHSGFTYTSVSLATFRKDTVILSTADERDVVTSTEGQTEKSKSGVEVDVPELIDRIEQAIVQQLLYSVPANKLPRTRLKRIVQASRSRAVMTTLLLILGSVSTLRLYLPIAQASKTVQPDWLIGALSRLPAALALIIGAAVAVTLIYQIARSLSLISVDGWSLKGGKVETVHHNSVLHKNLDEILYCFQNSSTDVVVIEDLDRFGVQGIFFRLREINAIINESPQIKRTVRFIYALNDELFAGGEKTKFFDLIVPVVPVINKENSHAKMIELLRRRSFDDKTYAEKLDPELVETVCYRIDDMRLVKNIVNEFDVFALVLLTDLQLDWNKLFAMIVIKNVHSDQYWGLTKRHGFVFELIAGYAEWRNEHATFVRAEIVELNRLLAAKKKDVARSKDELRMIAWYHCSLRMGLAVPASSIQRDHSSYALSDFLGDEVFDAFASSSSPHFLVNQNGQRMGQQFSVSEVLKEIDYPARLASITADDDSVHAEISAKTQYVSDMQKMPLAQGMRTGYQEKYVKDLTCYETIKYLLVAGHLDQDYPDYLGHFYGHTIDREDMNLLLTLRQGDECDVNTTIGDPEKLLKKLRLEHIDQGRGIITELIGYLCRSYSISAPGTYFSYLQKVFDDAEGHIERFTRAVASLIERGDGKLLVRAIFDLKSTLLAAVLTKGFLPDATAKQALVVAVLDTLTQNEVRRLHDDGGSIRKIVESLTDVSLLVPRLGSPTGGWLWIKTATIQFDCLGTNTSAADLASLIGANALSPSLAMLHVIASKGQMPQDDRQTVTVRLILGSGIDGADRFVTAHAEIIVRELLGQAGELDESPDSLLFALRAMKNDEELSVDYFGQTACTFPALDLLPRSVWGVAMRSDRIDDRAAAMRLYEKLLGEMDEDESGQANLRLVLSDYAEAHVDDVHRDLWKGDADDERMQRWILTEVDLLDETAAKLLSLTLVDNSSLLTDEVSDARIQRLASLKCLALSEDIWSIIVQRSVDVQVAYLSTWWDEVNQSPMESLIPFSTSLPLYESGVMSVADALRLFAHFDDSEFTHSPLAAGLLARLSGQTNATGALFPTSLSRVSSLLLGLGHVTEALDRTHLRHLLSQGIPEMTWTVIASVLAHLGDGWEKLRPNRTFVIALNAGAEPILLALRRRGFFSSLDIGETEATGRMRKNVA